MVGLKKNSGLNRKEARDRYKQKNPEIYEIRKSITKLKSKTKILKRKLLELLIAKNEKEGIDLWQ